MSNKIAHVELLPSGPVLYVCGYSVRKWEGSDALAEAELLATKINSEAVRVISHEWNDTGERCVKCGDKDWMGGECSGGQGAKHNG